MEVGVELIGAIVGGLVVGWLFGRQTAPGADEARDFKKQLDEVIEEKNVLESKVNSHFAKSAEMFNQLTDQYREMYAHMASGAATLGSDSTGRAFKALEAPANDATTGTTVDAGDVVVEPPRDYAPKASPDDPGVLNEAFGLDKDAADTGASSDESEEEKKD
jgi:uncharacterized membrane-anchored protein YhcB (DUF1043 family)